MSIFLWILLAVVLSVLYVTTLIVLGLVALEKGHTALFFVGFLFPPL